MAEKKRNTFREIAVLPLVFYKKIVSPWLPRACLYTPTCSEYAMAAVRKHGLLKGFVFALARLFRCNGWLFDGGDDPVPEQFGWKAVADGYRKFFIARRKHDKPET